MSLLPGERVDVLASRNIKIIQSAAVFSFSLDAVLLADFAQIKRHSRVVDLAAGNGAVGLFLAGETDGQVTMVELQPRLADMARRSVELNHLKNVDVHVGDLAQTTQVVAKDSVDVVTCNPPYFKVNDQSITNPNDHLALARHELTTDFATVAKVSADLLKYQGKAYFVHRPERLTELLATLTAAGLAPKQLQFIHPREDREANMVLIAAIKAGRPDGLRIMPPLIVHKADGSYTPVVRRLLHGE
ncbi:tRNA1(Val) (adenine(37)-N6)-methyltransferase [Lacticaseibacillus casei]|uniref:tRNA1(Val) (adenine(37)-N6)-methyltransferase n=1 Tax=Lacticaseibacillus casei TaxID=1582 RepID=UPI00237E0723|nr:tRNA1(Val) (adenine(37)-N6)-methyltransferase [Lacticaseibacillus casei]MDE3282544.1 tRNA1(Val) (adenine(37)-N6)-methyltransferase [Lacticaseibacillus casei]